MATTEFYTAMMIEPMSSREQAKNLDDPVKTLVLVDDESDLRQIVRFALETPTLRILEAGNGHEALRLARQVEPDLIVIDWMMPGITGIEVIQILRRDPRTANIPIIMLTSQERTEEIDRLSALGPFAFLPKPFNPIELIQTVERAL